MANADMQGKFIDFIQNVGRLIGMEDLAPNEDGLVSLGVDSHELHIQCIPSTGKLLLFTSVTSVGKDSPAEIYKALLGANLFAQETGGGWFGLEGDSDEVIYHYLVDFDPLPPDVEDFVSAMEKIVELAEYWQRHILDVETPLDEIGNQSFKDVGNTWFIKP